MKNINEVRAQLAQVFESLKSGEIKADVAGELNNAAGKIIKSLQVELEYHKARRETPEIEFFNKK